MRNIDARANTMVISLAARRKNRAAWDKPLTTEYTTNKQNNVKLYYFKEHKRLRSKQQASSDKRRAAGYRLWK
jgi:hypothetical protein